MWEKKLPEGRKIWHVISLGAGVQSSVVALMAAKGLITPAPDFAIFADTQDEPKHVYDWLGWLKDQLNFPVHIVTAGRLSDEATNLRIAKKGEFKGQTYARSVLPVYTLDEDKVGKIRHRTCTIDYKIRPIMKAQRKLCSIPRACKEIHAVNWIGISQDEIQRVKDSKELWCVNRFPLLEMGMTRADCIRWMKDNNYPEPPRSSCVFCPFHSDQEWQRIKTQHPEEFAKAIEFEKKLQEVKAESANMRAKPFLHRSCKPIGEIDFTENDPKQGYGWMDECEGMCGM